MVREFNDGLDVGKRIDEGGVLAKIYLGVQGTDEEAAKEALESMVYNKLAAEKEIKLLQVKMYNILKEDESDFFSGVSEVELIADEYRFFLNMIMRYGPSAVEIIEPEKVTLNTAQMHSIVADLADYAHMYSQQLIEMLKDPERRALYERMLSGEK